jgi:hypothetical protein
MTMLVTAVLVANTRTNARTNASTRSKTNARTYTRAVAVLVTKARANAGASVADGSISNDPSPVLIVRVEGGCRDIAARVGRAQSTSV